MFASLEGRSVIVTGGSRGIGRGIALAFARTKAKLTIVGRDRAHLEQAVAEMKEAGAVARSAVCDVSNFDQVREMVDEAAGIQGGLHVMCANAGSFPQVKIIDLDPAGWDEMMANNLRSTFLCVKASIPHFAKAGSGRVVVTSSITGPLTGYPGWSHYGASKAGQLGFIKTAAMELARYNTTINAVMPGNILTEGLMELGEEYLSTMAKTIPLKRLGSVEDIGNAALFLSSDEAGYITGQHIVVDGGQVLPESTDAVAAI
ncbi:MAG: 3-oxoacyl-ACP reductase FabG [Mesorhizobium sp.]|uniref:3-oxoacyl-ACP reductase FabG n=1 Tax=Mesorhizobium sp. TaxID=1871066 RepID=UPI000FE784FE|nr:3-oxoacyl-ACP reductase FabG [Mesorhizobium sp.]RWI48939.1 MAG: 3-oxoacyl-ACP reductase FabG [Mesorhizobium sp.]